MMQPKIRVNKAKCRECGDVVESKHRHDFRHCSCGAIAVDGGREYIRRVGWPDKIEELSEYEAADTLKTNTRSF